MMPPPTWRLVSAAMRMGACAAKVERLIAAYDPDIVQIEYMELAALAERRRGRARWIMSLHDVYVSGNAEDSATDRVQHDLLRPL